MHLTACALATIACSPHLGQCPPPTRTPQATLKAVARIQRYEALPHRMVTLELALHHFAMGKFESSCALLAQVCLLCATQQQAGDRVVLASSCAGAFSAAKLHPTHNAFISNADKAAYRAAHGAVAAGAAAVAGRGSKSRPQHRLRRSLPAACTRWAYLFAPAPVLQALRSAAGLCVCCWASCIPRTCAASPAHCCGAVRLLLGQLHPPHLCCKPCALLRAQLQPLRLLVPPVPNCSPVPLLETLDRRCHEAVPPAAVREEPGGCGNARQLDS